ncbi:hypothetical protein NDU88_007421, partial [Pleurodeles waltl]
VISLCSWYSCNGGSHISHSTTDFDIGPWILVVKKRENLIYCKVEQPISIKVISGSAT